MSEKTALKDSLTCSVCLDTFREPVSLGCHHSFCHSCLKDYWDRSTTRNCPVCKRRWSKDLNLNFALKQVADSFAGRQEAGASEQPKREGAEEVCSHGQGQQTERELRDKITSELDSLTQHKDKYEKLEKLYEEMTQHSKKQAAQCQRHIRAVFSRLHQFLKEEETRAMEALRDETQRQAQNMSPELGRVREELASVETTIQELKGLLEKDTETLMKHFNITLREAKAHSSQPEPQPSTGLLLDQAKVLGNLDYRVWRSMRREVNYSPVILNPNTATCVLYLSEDLRGVRHGDTERQKVPSNPERFTKAVNVLGSEGFMSGIHQWDVEVGDHPAWNIGVAKESVDRKGETFASPKYGIWCLVYDDGKYYNGCSVPVPVQKPPQKIRVLLDYDLGELSFYDPDHMTHLYTHSDTFTEKLFPYFSLSKAKSAKTKEIRILPSEAPQSDSE